MKKNKLGRTDLNISEVVLGGGWVGGLFIDPSYDVMEKALELSIEAGINWIDTAETYSDGKSEKNIGDLLESISLRNQLYVSSKARLDTDTSETFASQLDRKLDKSLKRLKRDHLDLYQLHNKITLHESVGTLTSFQITKKNSICDAFDKLKEDGRVKNVGITALGDNKAIKEVVATNRIDTAQVYYNLLNPSAGFSQKGSWNDHDFSSLISECQKNDMGIIGIRVFAAGLLATDIRHGREIPVTNVIDIKEEERRVKKIYDIVGLKYGNRAQFAIRYGLSKNNLSCIVLGLASLEHLENALDAVKMGPLPDDVLEEILKLQLYNFV